MKYAALIEYSTDREKTEALRPTHRQYLRDLLATGRLAAAGPFLDGWGALIIYEAGSPEEAEAILKGDPFHAGGIFVQWTIRPWNCVMANHDLFPAS
jgi:uncharacterized protein YciI